MAKSDWVLAATHVTKPWGSEEIFALAAEQYCGKILRITKGHALSLQLHERKDETIAVQSGTIRLRIGRSAAELEEFELLPGETVRIRPGVVHRMTAVSDAVVLEASTTELHDVLRLEDRYGREGTSAA